jgi:hypothetical protein
MTVCEKFKNGKLTKKHADHVLDLAERDVNSLHGCYFNLCHYQERKDRLYGDQAKEEYDADALIDLYKTTNDLILLFEKVFKENTKDLYEFFYDKVATEKEGYYSFHFSIDIKKFEKQRVPEKEMRAAMVNMKNNAKNICLYMAKNYITFCKILKAKRKINVYHKPSDFDRE